MIAAILDMDKSPCATIQTINEMARGLPNRHDVIDSHFLRRTQKLRRLERVGAHFLGIANDAGDFRHAGKAFRVNLSGAARDNDRAFRVSRRARRMDWRA